MLPNKVFIVTWWFKKGSDHGSWQTMECRIIRLDCTTTVISGSCTISNQHRPLGFRFCSWVLSYVLRIFHKWRQGILGTLSLIYSDHQIQKHYRKKRTLLLGVLTSLYSRKTGITKPLWITTNLPLHSNKSQCQGIKPEFSWWSSQTYLLQLIFFINIKVPWM